MFMENYFRTGYSKYIETKDFKTFAKDKNNSIIQIRLAIKLLPQLNHHVIFVGLIIKENINDIIYVDDNFNIQGICDKLKSNLKINNNNLFQFNDIPFYIICKKFINFYKVFLSSKKNDKDDEPLINEVFKKKTNSTLKDNNNNEKANGNSKRKQREKEEELIKKEENLINKQIQENYEINENFELEFEIKFPQFLINYSNKTKFNKKIRNLIKEDQSPNTDEEMDEEDNELLMSNFSKKKLRKKNSITTPTSPTITPNTFGEAQTFPLNLTFLNIPQEPQEKFYLNKSEEEKMMSALEKQKLSDLSHLFRNSQNSDIVVRWTLSLRNSRNDSIEK